MLVSIGASSTPGIHTAPLKVASTLPGSATVPVLRNQSAP